MVGCGCDGADLPTYDTLSAARGGVDAGAGLTMHCALLCLLCLFISTANDVQPFRFNGPSWEGEVEETTINRLFGSWEGHWACSLIGAGAGLGWLVLVFCESKTLLAGWFGGLVETNKRTG